MGNVVERRVRGREVCGVSWSIGGGSKHGYCGEYRSIWEFVGNGACRGVVDGMSRKKDMNECHGLLAILGYKEKSSFYIKNSMK